MSYKALVETCVNIHSFRNINLTLNGVYSFRFRMYQETGQKVDIADIDFSISESDSNLTSET